MAHLKAVIEAKEAGKTRFVGITGHGTDIARLHLRALEIYPFDSPFCCRSIIRCRLNADYMRDFNELRAVCRERGIAMQTIKAVTRRPWGEQELKRARPGINLWKSKTQSTPPSTGCWAIIPKFSSTPWATWLCCRASWTPPRVLKPRLRMKRWRRCSPSAKWRRCLCSCYWRILHLNTASQRSSFSQLQPPAGLTPSSNQ